MKHLVIAIINIIVWVGCHMDLQNFATFYLSSAIKNEPVWVACHIKTYEAVEKDRKEFGWCVIERLIMPVYELVVLSSVLDKRLIKYSSIFI